MDICFIPDDDYRRFLREEQPETIRPGPITDRHGNVLGRHNGLPLYTVGQRKGLGITGKVPLYVIELDVARNILIVGPAEELSRGELLAENVSFVDGSWPVAPFRCLAQIRSHAQAVPVSAEPVEEGQLRLRFDVGQRAVSPGQAVVLYDDQVVIGGGRITVPEPVLL
jgi:tRNA-specific 2-thiouridylase